MPHSDPELAALMEADPAADVTLTPTEARVYLAATLAGSSRTRPTRWRRRAIAATALLVGLGISVPGVAYGGWFRALTGEYVNPFTFESTQDRDPDNQVVEKTSPDFPQLVASEWPSYVPLPEAYDQKVFVNAVGQYMHDSAVAAVKKDGASGFEGTVAEIHGDLEHAGRCVWIQEWLDAAPGSAQRSRASSVLRDSVQWPQTVATDGGGVVDSLRKVAQAAKDGNASVVREEDSLNCTDYRHFPGVRK